MYQYEHCSEIALAALAEGQKHAGCYIAVLPHAVISSILVYATYYLWHDLTATVVFEVKDRMV